MVGMRNKRAWARIITVVLLVLICFSMVQAAHPADYNDDKRIDFEDFALLANTNWNWQEIATLADDWLWAMPMDMAYIPAGEFRMGDHFDEGYSSALPLHDVLIDQFYMGRYEVTNREYCEFLNSALAESDIDVVEGVVYAKRNNDIYCSTYAERSRS
jgi:formylglycine-generating enzyme required for sulfatase activity